MDRLNQSIRHNLVSSSLPILFPRSHQIYYIYLYRYHPAHSVGRPWYGEYSASWFLQIKTMASLDSY